MTPSVLLSKERSSNVSASLGVAKTVKNRNVRPRLGQQLRPDDVGTTGVEVGVGEHVLVFLDAMLLTFLEGLEGGSVAEQLRGPLDKFGPGAPRAGRLGRLAAAVGDVLAESLQGRAVLDHEGVQPGC